MKKCILPVIILTLLLAALGCAKQEQAPVPDKWDCSLTCAETSAENAYVITWSEKEIISSTGVLTFQNRNGFDIVVHLVAAGQEEEVIDVFPHGVTAFLQAEKDVPYAVGIHADVEEGTEISLMVYDGERSEPYTMD